MNRDEILKKAQQERTGRQCDEREKNVFNRSFYWAFLTMLIGTFVFAAIDLIRGINPDDKICIINCAAFAALTYRLIQNRRAIDVLLLLCSLAGVVGSTIMFVKGM